MVVVFVGVPIRLAPGARDASIAPSGDPSMDAAAQRIDPQVSVVLPCLDEAATVAGCIEDARSSLTAAGLAHEILVCDNGSTDGSIERARAAGATVVEVATRGYGAAVAAGLRSATAPYVVIADSDGSYALDRLAPFLDLLRAGDDLVMGDRFGGGIAPGAMPPLHRYVGNPVISWLARVLFDTGVHDVLCGIRAVRRDAILALPLREVGFPYALEMVVISRQHGLRISEVPTTLRPDARDRRPHLRTWRHGWQILRTLLRLRRRGRSAGR